SFGELGRIRRRHDEDRLADPDDSAPPDEALGPPFVRPRRSALRSTKHDLADARGDGSFGTGDVVRNQDPFSVVTFDRHRHLYCYSHIISFPPAGRKDSFEGRCPSDRTTTTAIARMLNMLTRPGPPRYAEIRSPSMARIRCASSTATRRRGRSRCASRIPMTFGTSITSSSRGISSALRPPGGRR